MCYINKLAMPLDLSVETLTEKANIKIFGEIFYFLEGTELSSLLLYHYVYIGSHFIIIIMQKKKNQLGKSMLLTSFISNTLFTRTEQYGMRV